MPAQLTSMLLQQAEELLPGRADQCSHVMHLEWPAIDSVRCSCSLMQLFQRADIAAAIGHEVMLSLA